MAASCRLWHLILELELSWSGSGREMYESYLGPPPGSGRNAPVALQLPGVPDLTRGDVEDWLREKERETEGVMGATLKWAKIAGVAALIGVIVTALVGIAGIVVTLYTSGP
jgi:hypothetical protein